MILDCFEEGDHFESNKIETSGVSIKSVSFLFCRYRNSSSDIAAHTAFKHDLSKHFSNSDMGLHIELYFRDAEFVQSRESGKWSSKIEQSDALNSIVLPFVYFRHFSTT